ncbi:MAG: pseudouridine synthase [Thermomicrobiales bacterium]
MAAAKSAGPGARPPAPSSTTEPQTSGTGERLHKVLAARGVASRRAAEQLMLEGRVTVDGRVVRELGARVEPERAVIRVDGRVLRQPRQVYLLLNKPRGYITTASDPQGRRTVFDLLDPHVVPERVYAVGRLDMDSEGLLLLTNDGELANRIMHPRYRLDKEYHAFVDGEPPPAALDRLRRGGFLIAGGHTSPAEVAILGQAGAGVWLSIVIHEGRKHQVRQMLEEVGHPVRRLQRVRLGPITLAGLAPGAYRPLTPDELARLRQLVGLAAAGERPERPAPSAPARARPAGEAAREAGYERGGREYTGRWYGERERGREDRSKRGRDERPAAWSNRRTGGPGGRRQP